MSGEPWSKFFWKDWETDPGLRLCSLAAQGLWLRLLCIAAASTIKGEVRIGRRPCTNDDIARIVGIKEKEANKLITELEQNGVFDRAPDGAIVSRRMVRDAQNHAQSQADGKKGGRPKIREIKDNSYNPPVSENKTPRARARAASASASDSPSDGEVEGERKGVRGKGSGSGGAVGWPEWWTEYPHKVGKRDAEAAYRAAVLRAGPADLLTGVRRYVATKPRDRPWCNPATWLDQDRWLDEPAIDPAEGVNGHAAGGRTTALENLYLGAARAAETYAERQQRERDRRAGDAPVVPLLDGRRTGRS